jgi:hypothetical protein
MLLLVKHNQILQKKTGYLNFFHLKASSSAISLDKPQQPPPEKEE